MNAKQLGLLGVVLAVLLAAGAWVKWSDDAQWKSTDSRVGTPLLPGLKVADVSEIKLTDAKSAVTLKRSENDWAIVERQNFPADVERIREMLLKLVELKISQVEALSDKERARLVLVEPKGPETKDAGTVLELRGEGGKTLARVLLGRVISKRIEEMNQQGRPVTRDVPSGRYVAGADGKSATVVTDALTQADAAPTAWLVKDLFRIENPKTLVSTTSDGKPRWAFNRDTDSVSWKFIGSSDKIDLQKAQDVVNPLSSVSPTDVADPAKVVMDKGVQLKADTFDGYSYVVSVGEPTEAGLYPLRYTVSGEFPTARVAPKGESAEDKAREDKAFEERSKALADKLAREKKFAAWTYLVPKTTVESMLRDRAGLFPDKKEEKKAENKK